MKQTSKLLLYGTLLLLTAGCTNDKNQVEGTDSNKHLEKYVLADEKADHEKEVWELVKENQKPFIDHIQIDSKRFMEEWNAMPGDYEVFLKEDMNEGHNLLFGIRNKENKELSSYYLTAFRDPESEMLKSISLTRSEFKSLTKEFDGEQFLEITRLLYEGLTLPEQERDLFFHRLAFFEEETLDEPMYRSFEVSHLDAFAERNKDSVTVAFHPGGSTSVDVIMEDKLKYGEFDDHFLAHMGYDENVDTEYDSNTEEEEGADEVGMERE